MELEQLLAALTDVNEKMNSCPHGSSVATIHTLQRHRDILQVGHFVVAGDEFVVRISEFKLPREVCEIFMCRSTKNIVGNILVIYADSHEIFVTKAGHVVV